jgi:hypothetical protein
MERRCQTQATMHCLFCEREGELLKDNSINRLPIGLCVTCKTKQCFKIGTGGPWFIRLENETQARNFEYMLINDDLKFELVYHDNIGQFGDLAFSEKLRNIRLKKEKSVLREVTRIAKKWRRISNEVIHEEPCCKENIPNDVDYCSYHGLLKELEDALQAERAPSSKIDKVDQVTIGIE